MVRSPQRETGAVINPEGCLLCRWGQAAHTHTAHPCGGLAPPRDPQGHTARQGVGRSQPGGSFKLCKEGKGLPGTEAIATLEGGQGTQIPCSHSNLLF